MLSSKTFTRFIGLSCALFACTLFFSGCAPQSPVAPTQKAAQPTLTPSANGTYTTAVTVTSKAAAGTIGHCAIDALVNAAFPECSSFVLSTNGTHVIQAYDAVTDGSLLDSAIVTVTITINIPSSAPAPAIAVLPTFSINLNDDSLIAPIACQTGTCDPTKLAVTVTPVNGITTRPATVFFPYYYSGGGLSCCFYGGGTLPVDKSDTFNVEWNYDKGSSVAHSILTVNVLPPCVYSVTPSVVAASGARTWTVNGCDFISKNNPTNDPNGLWGTEVYMSSGATCPTAPAPVSMFVPFDGTSQSRGVSPVFSVGGLTSSSPLTIGAYSTSTYNAPTASGKGGGTGCKAHTFDVTATGMVSTGTNSAVSANFESGQINYLNNGVITASDNLGPGVDSMLATTHGVYVISPSQNAVAKLDEQTHGHSLVSIGEYKPVFLAKDEHESVYVAAMLLTDSAHSEILRVENDSVTNIVAANGLTSFAISGSMLLWTTNSQDLGSTIVHTYDLNSALESTTIIRRQAATIVGYSSNTALVYTAGTSEVAMLNLETLQEANTLIFANTIIAIRDGLVALSDGSVGTIAVHTDGAGNSALSWTALAKAPSAIDVDGGFAIAGSTLYVNHRSAQGLVPMVIHTSDAQ